MLDPQCDAPFWDRTRFVRRVQPDDKPPIGRGGVDGAQPSVLI